VELENYKERILNLINDLLSLNLEGLEIKNFQDIKDKLYQFKPSIMVYGVFNTGKSTLINALLENEVAKSGDIPVTDSIDTYTWNGYTLYDTPGINAPIEHEEITLQHIDKTDVIFFVLSTASEHAEARIYEMIVELIKKNKPLIIVINDKESLMESEEIEQIIDSIATQLYKRLDNPKLMPQIIPVNSKDALEGYMENEQLLIDSSNIMFLKRELADLVVNKGGDGILNSSVYNLSKNIKDISKILTENIADKEIRDYQKFINLINSRKDKFLNNCRKKLRLSYSEITEIMILNVNSDPNVLIQSIQPKMESYINGLLENFKIEVKERHRKLWGITKDLFNITVNIQSSNTFHFNSKVEQIDIDQLMKKANKKNKSIHHEENGEKSNLINKIIKNKKDEERKRQVLEEISENLNQVSKAEMLNKRSIIQERILFANKSKNNIIDKYLSNISVLIDEYLEPITKKIASKLEERTSDNDKLYININKLEDIDNKLDQIKGLLE